MEVFEIDKKCDLCSSAEGVRKVTLMTEDNREEEKYLCASCVMAENFKAYLSLTEQKK